MQRVTYVGCSSSLHDMNEILILSTPTDQGPAKGGRKSVQTGRGTLFQPTRLHGRPEAVVELPRSRKCRGEVVPGHSIQDRVYRDVSLHHAGLEDYRPPWLLIMRTSRLPILYLPLFPPADVYLYSRRPSASERSKDRFDPESCTLSMTYRFTALGREKHLSGKWSFSWLRWFLIPAGAFVLYQSVAFYNQRKRRMADETERRTKEQTPYRKKLRSHKRGCQTE